MISFRQKGDFSNTTKFLEKASKLGHDINTSKTIFSSILKFAGYGFNKSHAVAYSLVDIKWLI